MFRRSNKVISFYLLPFFILTGCASKKATHFPGYNNLSEASRHAPFYTEGVESFDGASYEKTLRYIGTFSVFSSPGDNFAQEIHKLVFDAISTPPKDDGENVKNLFWGGIPDGAGSNAIFDTFLKEQKLDDARYSLDFMPHLMLKRCARFYKDDPNKDSRIRVCLLVSQNGVSTLDELKIQTDLFGLASKLALDFADPFGHFIFESELSSRSSAPESNENIETRELSDTIGYIRIKSFESRSLPDDLAKEIQRLEESGRGKIILDLRGNTGGDAAVTVSVASLFFPIGAPLFLYRQRDSEGKWNEAICETVQERPLTYSQFKGAIVVLTDHLTASAAEVMVAAFQTNKRALTIGQRTFGKGIGYLIGRLNALGYQSKGVMTLSTLIVYHPATGHCWHRDPIEPDVLLGEDIVSQTTLDEADIGSDVPYRMTGFEHISNRALSRDLVDTTGGRSNCQNWDEFVPSTNPWDSFISNKDLQQELLEKGREGGSEEDLPLYLAIAALGLLDPI